MSENSQSAGSGYEAALSSQEPSRQEDWEIRLGFVIHDAARMRRIIIDEKFKPLGVINYKLVDNKIGNRLIFTHSSILKPSSLIAFSAYSVISVVT